MKKFFVLSALSLVLSSVAFAYPTVRFKYALNGQNEYQLKVHGEDLCDSATFRIRVTRDYTGDTGWYVSGSGNSQWNIGGGCKLDMFLAKKYLAPGNVLEVRTYAAAGRKTHSFAVVIPCEETRWESTFSDQWVDDRSESLASALSCGGGPVPGPGPSQPPPLSCSFDASVNQSNPSTAALVVKCNQQAGLEVAVYDASSTPNAGRLLCSNPSFFSDGSFSGAVVPGCTNIPRDRTHRLDYRVRINVLRGASVVDSNGVIFKDATFDFPPAGKIVSDKVMTPASQKKALGRGQYWEVDVKAFVVDNDVDFSEGQAVIKVELIDTTNGKTKVLQTRMVNTNTEVKFSLEHQYVKPLAFGQPHEDGDLVRGTNTLKVRVWDAYKGNTYVDLDPVTVNIQ